MEYSSVLNVQVNLINNFFSSKKLNFFKFFIHIYLFLGFHRELGTHISKVRSVNLDKWPKGIYQLFGKISNIKIQ